MNCFFLFFFEPNEKKAHIIPTEFAENMVWSCAFNVNFSLEAKMHI